MSRLSSVASAPLVISKARRLPLPEVAALPSPSALASIRTPRAPAGLSTRVPNRAGPPMLTSSVMPSAPLVSVMVWPARLGANRITSRPRAALAWSMAARRLPAPESAVLVTTMAGRRASAISRGVTSNEPASAVPQ